MIRKEQQIRISVLSFPDNLSLFHSAGNINQMEDLYTFICHRARVSKGFFKAVLVPVVIYIFLE